jgi:hypothetical protein
MAFYNNELYFVLQNAGKIVKSNPSTVNAPLVDVLTGLVFPRALRFIGSELFYIEAANSNGDPNTGKLSKINVSQSNPTPTAIATTLNLPLQMEVNANATKFYISEVTTNPDGTFEHTDLSVIDISGGTPAKTVLYNQYFNIEDIALKGNTLYVFAQDLSGVEGGHGNFTP